MRAPDSCALLTPEDEARREGSTTEETTILEDKLERTGVAVNTISNDELAKVEEGSDVWTELVEAATVDSTKLEKIPCEEEITLDSTLGLRDVLGSILSTLLDKEALLSMMEVS